MEHISRWNCIYVGDNQPNFRSSISAIKEIDISDGALLYVDSRLEETKRCPKCGKLLLMKKMQKRVVYSHMQPSPYFVEDKAELEKEDCNYSEVI